MISLTENTRAVGSSAYFGDRGDWYIAAAVHRDSDSLTRSNWQVLCKRLGAECDSVAIERFTHWAVGWVDYLLIHPDAAEKIAIADAALASLDDYPVLDESHWSELEHDEFWTWAESELRHFAGWETVLDRLCQESNSGPGDQTWEWEAIEAARNELEAAER